MTGPEHYREAEKLVDEYNGGTAEDDRAIELAGVHATLALAAATAGIDGATSGAWSRLSTDAEGWRPIIAPAGVTGGA